MAPNEVTRDNWEEVWNRLYANRVKTGNVKEGPFKSGDWVRIAKQKKAFEKGYLPLWSDEIFKVKRRIPTNPLTYEVRDQKDELMRGRFYAQHLSKTKSPAETTHRIAKVHRTRINDNDRALDKAIASYQRVADEYKLEVQKCMQEAVKASKDKPELKSKLRDCDEEKRAARTRRRILAKHGDLEYLSYSAAELVSVLRSIHITYIPEIDRFSFRTIHPHIKGLQFTSALAYALGFSNADGMQRGGTLGRWPPAQFVSEIAIFADFVAPRILGEHLEPLLDVIPIDDGRNTSLIDRTHPLPDFCRAGVTELNEMRLSLRTLSGKPLNNLQGTIICKLLFRQNQS